MSVYKDKNGTWYVMTRCDDWQGQRKQKCKRGFKTKREVEYDTVFFVGLEDAAFWNFINQPEEDRCAFFVALSRAKSEVSFSFCKNRNHKTQKHNDINEFFDLLQEPGIANIITAP